MIMACYTWITKKDGKVNDVCQEGADKSPGSEWEKVPNDWNGHPGDDLAWFDSGMRRIPDTELVRLGLRKDNRGIWYNKATGESKDVSGLDEEPGEDWTEQAPLENEPYQKWGGTSWIVDTGAKEKAEKNRRSAEKKAAIENAEKRIQRSALAKLAQTATEDDEEYFQTIQAEIAALREELHEINA
jgi:hypothetical protein